MITPRLRRLAPVVLTLGLLTAVPLPSPSSNSVEAQVADPDDDGFVPLFNGENLDGWYTFTPSQGVNNDTEGVFEVVDGELRILDVPDTGEVRDFGYLATDSDYADYHLRLEYQWGEEKFTPRDDLKRDSGLLYHVRGEDRIWPTTVEAQIQEGDTGDYFMLGGPLIDTTAAGTPRVYDADAPRIDDTGGRIVKSSTEDTLDGWNTVEVIVRGDSSVHIVNGVVVNRSFGHTFEGEPLTSGRIAIQAEGATVSYRNIEIKDLSDPADEPRVLAFSRTEGFRHASIGPALDTLDELGAANGFTVDRTEDPADFTDANLANYDAVAFVSTTGNVLDPPQEAAFEQYIRGGGGFVGIHAATDTEYEWAWYGDLVGAYFDRHPAVQEATIDVEDREHPSTAHLDETWVRTDEWYDFRTNPRGDVNVLLSLDESTYEGGGMGDDHPIAWFSEVDAGRSWYTGGGHTIEAYAEPDFRQHLLGGIQYAIGAGDTTPPPPPPAGPGEPLDRSGWVFDASSGAASVTNVVDGDIATRWSSGTKQEPGMFFEVDLGAVESFDRIELAVDASEPFDSPRGYEVFVSDDGVDFGEPIASGAGATDPELVTAIEFAPVDARFVRIEQTGSDVFRWWSIYELNLFSPS